ncbi:MAG: glycosyltransferase family 4 protein [Parcubacteria group bacterium]|nr:glycosyltransferase family 4 protein [Parcubacteria group bacterium]
MKYLLITLEYPPMTGGVANYLAGVCSVLKDVRILKPKSFRLFWPKWIPAFFQAKKIIKQENTKIVMISHILPMGYVALLLRVFCNTPYIVFTHGLDILTPQSSGWKNFWMKVILKWARLVVANSNFTRNEILKLGIKKEKTEIIYPCPNSNIKNLQFNKMMTDKKIILSVGRLVERKGFDRVIEAMPKILQEIPGLIYMIVGDGPYKKNLLELKEKYNLGERVNVISNVGDNGMHVYYGMSDVFVMPSRQIGGDVEGFGIVYLEAALFGKPSIAGCDGGSPEAVLDNQTGLIVDGNNSNEIADAIIRLIKDNDLRQRLGKNARERVVGEFTWEKQVEKLKRKTSSWT